MLRRTRLDWLFGSLGAVFTCLVLFGCGAKDEQITSKNSKFRAKGASETASAEGDAESEKSTDGEKAPASDGDAASETASTQKPSTKPPVKTVTAGEEETAPPEGENRYPVPDTDDIIELQKFIQNIERRQPRGASRSEQMADIIELNRARIAAGEKILSLKVDAETKAKIVGVVQDSYITLLQLEAPGAREGIQKFFERLAADEDPILARVGRLQLWGIEVTELMTVDPIDSEKLTASVEKVLKENPDSTDAISSVVQMALAMVQRGHRDDGANMLEVAGKSGLKSKDEEVVTLSKQCLTQAKAIRNNLETHLQALVKGDPDAEAAIIASCEKLLEGEDVSLEEFGLVSQAVSIMELMELKEGVAKLLAVLQNAFKDSKNETAVKRVNQFIENAQKRVDILGKPFVVEGVLADGTPFDFSEYAGKIVLVDFWATWCQPCLQEMPNIARAYQAYKSKGFEVVGVNLDGKIDVVREFLDLQPLPWKTVVDARVAMGEDLSKDFAHHPLAASSGVESIPFVVLVGKDGNVDSIHVRGPKLIKRLSELLGPPETAGKKKPKNFVELPPDAPSQPEPKNIELPANAPDESEGAETKDKPKESAEGAEKAPAETPAESPAEKPAEKPADAPPSDTAPEAKQVRAWLRPFGSSPFAAKQFASLTSFTCAVEADDKKPEAEEAKGDAVKKEEEVNPYLARPELSTKQLIDYLLKMEEKPRSIRARETFLAAVVDASDRVLKADPPATEKQQQIALEMKLDFLHEQSLVGNESAQKQLETLADTLKDDKREKIARRVQLVLMEKEAMAGSELPIAEIPALLTKLEEFFKKQTLGPRHLRVASATVGLINRIEDAAEQEKQFEKFGGMFAKASDKSLSKYGKKLLKAPESGSGEQSLVGKVLELHGDTVEGMPFDIQQLRGKVVIVDFWATWCGPCQREMPHLKELYEASHGKGLEVLGVSLDEDTDALNSYLSEHQIEWTTLNGSELQDTASRLGIRGIPTMLLLDKEGKVVAQAHNVKALQAPLEKLLEGQGK